MMNFNRKIENVSMKEFRIVRNALTNRASYNSMVEVTIPKVTCQIIGTDRIEKNCEISFSQNSIPKSFDILIMDIRTYSGIGNSIIISPSELNYSDDVIAVKIPSKIILDSIPYQIKDMKILPEWLFNQSILNVYMFNRYRGYDKENNIPIFDNDNDTILGWDENLSSSYLSSENAYIFSSKDTDKFEEYIGKKEEEDLEDIM